VITGAHAIVYSTDPDADRAFLADVLGFPHVDAGGGWLIFRLPPAEVAVHPSDESGVHELYLMTDDIAALVAAMRDRGVETSPIADQRWGLLTHVTLPGGGKLGIYEPRHASPPPHAARRVRASPKKKRATSAPARRRRAKR
jgi:catechol 2,3-dioxygenase-like lactoylglutathione lyase family enzyme